MRKPRVKQFEDYANKYKFVAMRKEDGILEVRFHAEMVH